MKLSVLQQKVIDLMNEGWELGLTQGFCPRAWLQKNGLGKGGETLNISVATLYSLERNKLIVSQGYSYPTRTYKLKE